MVKKNALRRIYKGKIARLEVALEDSALEPSELTAAFEAEILDTKAVEQLASTRKEDIQRLLTQIEDVQYNGATLGYPSGFDGLDFHLT